MASVSDRATIETSIVITIVLCGLIVIGPTSSQRVSYVASIHRNLLFAFIDNVKPVPKVDKKKVSRTCAEYVDAEYIDPASSGMIKELRSLL